MLSRTPEPALGAQGPHELRFADLSVGSQPFEWSARQWLVSRRHPRCVGCNPSGAHSRFECKPAIMPLDHFMRRLTFAPRRPLELRRPQFPRLSPDERTVLRVVRMSVDPRMLASSVGAAWHLVLTGVRELCDAARSHSLELRAVARDVSDFRFLRLAWSTPA